MIPDPAPPYELDLSGSLKDRVRQMIDRADLLGAGTSVRNSIAEILRSLIHEPREWGDPIHNLRHAKLVEYHGRCGDFLVVYAVHYRIPMVFMNEIIPLPNNPLFGQSFDD